LNNTQKKTLSKYKNFQRIWLKEPNCQFTLEDQYEEKILELLTQNKNLLPKLIKEIWSQPIVDVFLLSFIVISLSEDKDKLPTNYGNRSSYYFKSKFMRLNKNKGFFLLCIYTGIHFKEYYPFEIVIGDNKSFVNPQSKMEKFTYEDLDGGINIDEKSKVISYDGRLGKCVWKFKENELKLISEKLSQKFGAISYNNPGFDCKKAKTNIEKSICESYKLSNLDRVLNFIYLFILNNTQKKTLSKYKNFQRIWLKERSKINDEFDLKDHYEKRILKLLTQNKNLLPKLIKEIWSQPIVDVFLLSCIVISLSEDRENFDDGEGSSYFDCSEFMRLNKNKGFLLLCTCRGSYVTSYYPFEIVVDDNKSFVNLLSKIKEFTYWDFDGGINIDEKSKVISYDGRLGKCVWKFKENEFKLISEKLSQAKSMD
jgi:hypothetical protein